MHTWTFGIFFMVWIIVCVQSQQPDPCTNVTNLSDTSMQTNNTIPALGGSHYFGWHRYTGTSAGIITTECPTGNQCGTTQQSWINGTLPQPSDGIVSLTLCIRSGMSCCSRINSLNVRNCGSFLAYFLIPLPTGTNYCFNSTTDVSLVTYSTSTALPTTSTTLTTATLTKSTTVQPTSTTATTATTPKSTTVPTTIQTVSMITTTSSKTMTTVKSTSTAPSVLYTSTTARAILTTVTTDMKSPTSTRVISTHAQKSTTAKPTASTVISTKSQESTSDISDTTVITIVGIVGRVVFVIGVLIVVAVYISQRSRYNADGSHPSMVNNADDEPPTNHINARPRFDLKHIR